MVKKKEEEIKDNETVQQKIARLSKSIGVKLKTDKDIVNAERVSTGYLTIDYLVNGGIERGSFIALYGIESSLKTTVGLKMLREAQRRGDSCLIVNIEEGFNKKRLLDLGIDTSKVAILDDKMSGEEYYEVISQIIGEFDFVLIDSISMMMPTIEDDKTLDEGTIRAMEAPMHSRGLRKLQKNKKGAIVCMIAHEKSKVGSPVPSTYMPGGKAPQMYSNYILNFKIKERYDSEWKAIKADINKERKTDIQGYELAVIGKKVRNSSPNRNINLQVNLKNGEPRRGYEIAKLGLLTGVILRRGSIYDIECKSSVKGFDELASVLDADEELYEYVKKLIMDTIER
jgi:recombination protein RecA